MPTTATITPTLGSAPVTLQAGNYSAIDDRRFWGSGVREGVISGGSYQVIQRAAGANMTVDVASSVGSGAVVQGDSVTAQGNYFVPPTAANVNVDIAASDATNPRNDLVVLEVKDDQHDAGGLNLARVRVITGTANASAGANDAPGANGTPALPSSCLLLAVVRVTAAATTVTTAMINDRRPWAGGPPERVTSLPSPAADGQEVYYQSTTAGTGGGSSDTMSTAGAVWHLRYRNAFSGGSATYPWEYVGGAPVSHAIETGESLGSGSGFQNLATTGPIITAPNAGLYRYEAQSNMSDTSGASTVTYGVSVNDATPANINIISGTTPAASTSTTYAGNGEVTVTTANHTVRLKYQRNSTSSFGRRHLRIVPIRIV